MSTKEQDKNVVNNTQLSTSDCNKNKSLNDFVFKIKNNDTYEEIHFSKRILGRGCYFFETFFLSCFESHEIIIEDNTYDTINIFLEILECNETNDPQLKLNTDQQMKIYMLAYKWESMRVLRYITGIMFEYINQNFKKDACFKFIELYTQCNDNKSADKAIRVYLKNVDIKQIKTNDLKILQRVYDIYIETTEKCFLDIKTHIDKKSIINDLINNMSENCHNVKMALKK